MFRLLLAALALVCAASNADARPRAWCGWFMGQHLGKPERSLWLCSKLGSCRVKRWRPR